MNRRPREQDMRRLTIAGLIAASSFATVVVVAVAQELGHHASFWPRTEGRHVVHEWYSDIPWHQKLGTFASATQPIRDHDGVVLPEFRNYVQKIRTPALKGLRFNRFVTESHKNTKETWDPACDFLLHDGRACDAIEAAFLHDGPAVKKLGVIEALTGFSSKEILELRAF